eukprot:4529836-Karenia_brevis.AAC.1
MVGAECEAIFGNTGVLGGEESTVSIFHLATVNLGHTPLTHPSPAPGGRAVCRYGVKTVKVVKIVSVGKVVKVTGSGAGPGADLR